MSDRRTEERESIKRFEAARDAVRDHWITLSEFHELGLVLQRNAALDNFGPLIEEYQSASSAIEELLRKRMQEHA